MRADLNPDGFSARRRAWAGVAVLSLGIVAMASLPYLLAYTVPPDHVFGGILMNPVDGNSYLAKMRAGWRGEWLFTLPYTAEPGPGALLFSYYLFLGHLARWAGLSLDAVYHAARALSGLALLLSAYHFIGRFSASARARLAVWLAYSLGSGLGWLLVLLGRSAGLPPDLWVAEAIPFLSIYSHSHFALGAALMLWLVAWTAPPLAGPPRPVRLALVVAATTLLAQVFPLALLNVGLLLAAWFAWQVVVRRWAPRRWHWRDWLAPAVFGLSAAPWVAYDAWIARVHPVLAAWNALNVTPSPPVWEAALAGGALLLLAVPGLAVAARRGWDREQLLLVWLASGVAALYAPFALQRRLSMGLWMPLALLAGLGLRDWLWPRLKPRWRLLAAAAIVVMLVPSNLLVYAATLAAVARRDRAVFVTQAEAGALRWLEATAGRSIVAAEPEMSLRIPARTDARVIYGHPFETARAAVRRAEVEAFFAGEADPAAFVREHGVSYVVVNTAGAQPSLRPPADWAIAYAQGEVVIYAP